ncbi:ATP-dependent Lon protease pim1 [Quaeritorhiza haematococci]|nr:ATP-dependent Lon protease pim1 [Quaeritorhiza haematococci]
MTTIETAKPSVLSGMELKILDEGYSSMPSIKDKPSPIGERESQLTLMTLNLTDGTTTTTIRDSTSTAVNSLRDSRMACSDSGQTFNDNSHDACHQRQNSNDHEGGKGCMDRFASIDAHEDDLDSFVHDSFSPPLNQKSASPSSSSSQSSMSPKSWGGPASRLKKWKNFNNLVVSVPNDDSDSNELDLTDVPHQQQHNLQQTETLYLASRNNKMSQSNRSLPSQSLHTLNVLEDASPPSHQKDCKNQPSSFSPYTSSTENQYISESTLISPSVESIRATARSAGMEAEGKEKELSTSSTFKQKWARFREIPLPTVLERLIGDRKHQSHPQQSASTSSTKEEINVPPAVPNPPTTHSIAPRKPGKRASSTGRLMRRSPPLFRRLISGSKDNKVGAAGITVSGTSGTTAKKKDKRESLGAEKKKQAEYPVSTTAADPASPEVDDIPEGTQFKDEEEAAKAIAASKRFESRYKVIKQLGSGGHSTVRLATRVLDESPVVCKFIRKGSVWHWHYDPMTGRKIPLEIHLMRKFNQEGCRGIIRYIEHFEFGGRFVIVMEYLGQDWVDLYDYIELYGPVPEDDSREIFQQVVEIIEGLHLMGYSHNDVKDENILINVKTREVKLIDFGSATKFEPGKTCTLFYGTKKFAAPEAVNGEAYYPEAQEVWALGTLLYVLLFKMDPFKTDAEILELDICKRIQRHRNTPGGVPISDAALHALKIMLEKDWSRRLRMVEIRQLPFFRT